MSSNSAFLLCILWHIYQESQHQLLFCLAIDEQTIIIQNKYILVFLATDEHITLSTFRIEMSVFWPLISTLV